MRILTIICFRLTRDNFSALAKSIVEIFPNELGGTYFIPYTKNNIARGKLWDAYNNIRTKFSSLGLITRRTKTVSVTSSSTYSSDTGKS